MSEIPTISGEELMEAREGGWMGLTAMFRAHGDEILVEWEDGHKNKKEATWAETAGIGTELWSIQNTVV